MRKKTIAAILGNQQKTADIARHEEETMVKERIGNLAWLRKRIKEADADLLREMVKTMAERLIGTEADSMCGAEYGKRAPERVNQRNGYRTRRGFLWGHLWGQSLLFDITGPHPGRHTPLLSSQIRE